MGPSFLALFLCASLSVDVTDMSLDESSSSSELSELESSELESAKILGLVVYVGDCRPLFTHLNCNKQGWLNW